MFNGKYGGLERVFFDNVSPSIDACLVNIDDCFPMMQKLIGNDEVTGNLQMNVDVCRVAKSCSSETVCLGTKWVIIKLLG